MGVKIIVVMLFCNINAIDALLNAYKLYQEKPSLCIC